ncbi:hypothetical protein [Spiroplasma tabanidicola]|uniref:Uncharacterized protein n=1 Tax=Spiroplasma tabanidicola TaxID=324079 RepID=A0A6I6CDN0_9MOLU|nr:hypothetical protein [Spiroplasma tabanidicola]QGS52084.1 hypothetical protein STABA_v1c07280 [Spiroplasma tabanidicola]
MQKFKDFFTTKVKLKLIIFPIVFSVYFLFSLLMVIPGVGIESLRFINSIHKQIGEVMPKGVFVVDGKDVSYDLVMENVIKKAYTSDSISTLNSYETENYSQKRSDYEKFSNEWYETRWAKVRDEKGDVDLYDLGEDLIKFDKAVSTKFLSFGYVNSGIQWMFKNGGIKEIFSSSIRNDLLRNQTIIDQDVYESKLQASDPGISGIDVSASLGTLLVNNKIWYLNKQIENIKFGMNVMGHNIFKDKTLDESKMPKQKVETSELYVPFFTSTLDNLRAGVVFFLILLIVVIPCFTYTLTMLIINKKRGNS